MVKKVIRRKRNLGRRKRKRRSIISLRSYNNVKNIYRCKVMYSFAIYNAAGAVGSIFFSIPVNFPGQGRPQNGTYAAMSLWGGNYGVIVPDVVADLFGMFDKYRVHTLQLDIVPYYQNTTAATATPYPLNFIQFANDADDSALTTATGLNNLGVSGRGLNTSSANGMRIRHRFRNPLKGQMGWINCGNVAITPSTATTQNTTVPPNAFGSIKFGCPNVPATGYVGYCYATWYCDFRSINTV